MWKKKKFYFFIFSIYFLQDLELPPQSKFRSVTYETTLEWTEDFWFRRKRPPQPPILFYSIKVNFSGVEILWEGGTLLKIPKRGGDFIIETKRFLDRVFFLLQINNFQAKKGGAKVQKYMVDPLPSPYPWLLRQWMWAMFKRRMKKLNYKIF